jgi:DNA-binding MarR family transcriptional regulator
MLSKSDALPTEVHAVLRAYMDAIVLAEPMQLKVWKTAGVTLTQLRILRVLREGPCSASELAGRAGLSAPSLTRVLDRLEELSLVERVADQSDRRRISVRILPKGETLLGDQSIWQGTTFVDAVRSMSADERLEFVRVMRSFVVKVLDAQHDKVEG